MRVNKRSVEAQRERGGRGRGAAALEEGDLGDEPRGEQAVSYLEKPRDGSRSTTRPVPRSAKEAS